MVIFYFKSFSRFPKTLLHFLQHKDISYNAYSTHKNSIKWCFAFANISLCSWKKKYENRFFSTLLTDKKGFFLCLHIKHFSFYIIKNIANIIHRYMYSKTDVVVRSYAFVYLKFTWNIRPNVRPFLSDKTDYQTLVLYKLIGLSNRQNI